MSTLGRIVPTQPNLPDQVVENRSWPRIPRRLRLRIRLPECDVAFFSETDQINTRGAFVLVADPVPVGVPLEIEWLGAPIPLPAQARARVVRHPDPEEPPGMGIHFDWLSVEARSLIQALTPTG